MLQVLVLRVAGLTCALVRARLARQVPCLSLAAASDCTVVLVLRVAATLHSALALALRVQVVLYL